jgi:DUF3037 family protein
MLEEKQTTFRYRILRYTPNLIRDEWVNIGVLLEDACAQKRAARLIEEPAEIARVRRLHPNADEELLRALPGEFESRLHGPEEAVRSYLEKPGQTLSNVIQLGREKSIEAGDFDAELERLYHAQVAPPVRARDGVVESTRTWIKARFNDGLRRRRVPRLERSIRVEEFTQAGDPLRLDYGYRNGVRGFLHAVALGRDASQAKVLAYTAERIRARVAVCEFTAITEMEPLRENPRHQFIAKMLAEQDITIVPLNRVEKFAEELRGRLQ